MCGISGMYSLKSNNLNFREILKAISVPLMKRGPDNFDYWSDNNRIGFSHQRLSIIDLTTDSNQPMVSQSERLIITFNGEIYNYLEIKKELSAFGVKFLTNSDTEVLLSACEYWGVPIALEKLEGMFAFSIWDTELQKLYLIRDRVGEKPLYWSIQDNIIFFGSQISSIIANPLFKREIDYQSMSNFIYRGNLDYDESIYKAIQQVKPGSYITIDKNFNIAKQTYWDLQDKILKKKPYYENNKSYEDVKSDLSSLIDSSVQKTMLADVPLGSFLSGGIDSSLVASIMQKNSINKIKTFSIGFEDNSFDESIYAKNISNQLGTDHNELIINSNDILKLIPDLAKIYDEPFADSSQIPTFILSKFTKDKVKVALSGDGGDELFAGYNRYNWFKKIKNFNRFSPLFLRKFFSNNLRKLSPDFYENLFKIIIPKKYKPSMIGDKIYKVCDIIELSQNNKIYESLTSFWPENKSIVNNYNTNLNYYEKLKDEVNQLSDLLKLQILDFITYLPNDILTKVDRASMHSSLEVRVPLLNHKIVEYAFNMSDSYKIQRSNTKRILKDILCDYIPLRFFDRPKMGFAIPLSDWLRGPLVDWAENYLEKNKLEESNLNSNEIIKRWEEHKSGKRNWQYSLWNIIILQSWREKWRI